jgi:diguanylate cyclase
MLRVLVVWLLVAGLFWPPLSWSASESVEALLKQADSARSSDPQAFQQLLARLNALAGQATVPQQQYLAYLNAYGQAFEGHFDESVRQAKRLIETSTDINLQFRAGVLIVNSYAVDGHFNEGLHQLGQTLALIDRMKDPELRQYGFLAAATLYNEIGQYQLGQRYADMVIPAPASERMLCFANYLKFNALLNLDMLPADDASMVQAIDQCKGQHEIVMANLVRAGLTRKWIARGQSDKALEMLQAHLAEAQATRYPRLVSEVQSQLAELLFAKGDVGEAEAHAHAAAAQSPGIINTTPVVAAYRTLYQIAERRDDPVAALAYYKHYAEANKAYLTEVKARELAYQIVRQEAQQKNQQIELLNRQNAVLELQQQVDRTAAQNSRLLMLVIALFAALVGYWAYKTRRMHSSLRRMAETDALTGICNRHHFTAQAEKALSQCALAGEPAALLMFDLDHFKAINDSYGHTTGDWALKRVADTCKDFCRRIDHLGRIGGEEFAILLHGCDLHIATRLAEDCRVRLAGIDTHDSGFRFTITASFGVSATSLSGYDLAKLLSHADLMLYRAKREGRNRVRTYAPEMPITLRPQAKVPDEDTDLAHASFAPDGSSPA